MKLSVLEWPEKHQSQLQVTQVNFLFGVCVGLVVYLLPEVAQFREGGYQVNLPYIN
jgi:hypothetical protein